MQVTGNGAVALIQLDRLALAPPAIMISLMTRHGLPHYPHAAPVPRRELHQ